MSLRIRIFLMIGGLFICFAIISSLMESYVMRKGIKKAQQNMRVQIFKLNEQNRKDLESFVGWQLADSDTNLNSVLSHTTNLKFENLRFAPTSQNIQKGIWENASELLVHYTWIDFLQSTIPQQETTIIPDTEAINAAYRIPIDKGLAWVFFQGREQPYLGIKIPYLDNAEVPNAQAPNEIVSGIDPMPYLLFDVQKLMQNGSKPLLENKRKSITLPWAEGYSLQIEEIPSTFNKALSMLASQNLKPPLQAYHDIQKDIETGLTEQGGNYFKIPANSLLKKAAMDSFLEAHLEGIIERYTEVNLLWIYLTVFSSGMFGDELFSYPVPEGISLFYVQNDQGVALLSKDVLFANSIFDDKSYYEKNSSPTQISALANSMAVITPPNSDQIYFGNTARYVVKKASSGTDSVGKFETLEGFLTLGINCDRILEKLMLAVKETSLLVHNGKIVGAYGRQGKINEGLNAIPIDQMLGNRSGIISWDQVNYYYMHLHPFSEIDLHFFLLAPEQKEFAMLDELETESQTIVKSVITTIHINGIFLLILVLIFSLKVASSITKPIISLATDTKKVAQGKLDDIVIPKPKHQDELAVLCTSFQEMVSGLKEKEKVKGVLNKVVSEEVAKEILKGTVHLGGEEKKVTVLFADIRGFTALTEKMAPHDVIILLNTCMTKIAEIIDQHKGIIDKFIGDEVMALFGAPFDAPDQAIRAIRCAVDILAAIDRWNVERKAKGLPIIQMGIGVHTGEVLVGNMGAENRMNYTATGSNVNLAARLCSAAKGMEILISQATLEESGVEQSITYEKLPSISLKGFTQPVPIIRIQSLKTPPKKEA
ncbi:MAG: adenylate/guanylate cyclase domain-containing protein [Parachlamydiales bacterium]